MTKFLLDSGDPDEYREILSVAKDHNATLWGATTNPTLIAKKLSGQKFTQDEALALQKKIVLEIVGLLEGAVSAEVYADEKTAAEEMIEQGREIATWHERVVVKLPTTEEGFKARTTLRKEGILTNNTLVFSQEQIIAICLHEQIIQTTYHPKPSPWPPFISPFVGRLDDQTEDGMCLVENGMTIKELVDSPVWMLEASVRKPEHIARGLLSGTELITAPAKAYQEWFELSEDEQRAFQTSDYAKDLTKPAIWSPAKDVLSIDSVDDFMSAISSNKLNIHHTLTDKGIARFAEDWKAILK